MQTLDEIYKQMVQLPDRQYSDLIRKVDAERRYVLAREEKEHPLRTGMSRDEFATWIGRHHYSVDKGISRILYLPSDAPPLEVRLLEVNDLAPIPENAPIEAVDFMPNFEGIPFSVFVADVTPGQFRAITEGKLGLPRGWNLAGAQEVTENGK